MGDVGLGAVMQAEQVLRRFLRVLKFTLTCNESMRRLSAVALA